MKSRELVDYFRRYIEAHEYYTQASCINDRMVMNRYSTELKDLELKIVRAILQKYYGTESMDVFNELKRKADLYDQIKEITDD